MAETEIDPKSFVIKRRRKKYRFALFANSPLCFELTDWHKRDCDILEVGAGNGLFGVELATIHPEQTVIALDVKADRLQHGARVAQERGLKNIWFVRARADQLEDVVFPHSLNAVWLTFPDPFPKDRAAKHRMSHERFLTLYDKSLRPGGAFYLKHDNPGFFEWSKEQLHAAGWNIGEESNNLHESNLPDEYKILTTYEKRWLSEGLATNFLKATKSKSD